ncbi:MscS family membrane protein [Rhizobiales bacterium GAS113]|nr:MscS family membrane protein [Rhizobiales bacterium GAS113]
MTCLARRATCLCMASLLKLVLAFSNVANAAEVNPLRPVDTSSPRATLQGFTVTMDDIYLGMKDFLQGYEASQRLYPTPDERHKQFEVLSAAPKAIRVLDLSAIPPVLHDTAGAERALQLKEILDRIEWPSFNSIPDQEAMARASSKRWRLPGTEIDIALIEAGPRSGEYLVSAESVDRLPEFYERVKNLPYKPGAAAELSDAYRRVSSGGSTTIYDAYLSSPVGLELIVPIRWMLALPAWANARIVGLASWQWLALIGGLAVCLGFVYWMNRLGSFLARRRTEESSPGWHAVLTPLAIILVCALPVPFLLLILRIGGAPGVGITFVRTCALYVSAAWLSMIGANLLADAFVASEHLRQRSLDSQLIRLAMRFIGIAIAIGILIQGAYELGFPAYSVLAGLGVGGLAVALAARDSLANLLGSILIMIEKPFRVGHYVRVTGAEGTVEDVGFRSTRIRTSDNSVISIPNSSVVDATVENLSLRSMRRQRFLVQVTYDTPRGKLEELVAGITRLLADHPMTNKVNINVRFNDLGESSLNILVYFYLETADYSAELKAREEILLRIMDLAKQLDIEFAFPTRTLVIGAAAAADVEMPQTPLGAIRGTAAR